MAANNFHVNVHLLGPKIIGLKDSDLERFFFFEWLIYYFYRESKNDFLLLLFCSMFPLVFTHIPCILTKRVCVDLLQFIVNIIPVFHAQKRGKTWLREIIKALIGQSDPATHTTNLISQLFLFSHS